MDPSTWFGARTDADRRRGLPTGGDDRHAAGRHAHDARRGVALDGRRAGDGPPTVRELARPGRLRRPATEPRRVDDRHADGRDAHPARRTGRRPPPRPCGSTNATTSAIPKVRLSLTPLRDPRGDEPLLSATFEPGVAGRRGAGREPRGPPPPRRVGRLLDGHLLGHGAGGRDVGPRAPPPNRRATCGDAGRRTRERSGRATARRGVGHGARPHGAAPRRSARQRARAADAVLPRSRRQGRSAPRC